MNHLGLTGTTIAAGTKTTAVTVEGSREDIIMLKDNLRRQSPDYLLYTRIEYGEEETKGEGVQAGFRQESLASDDDVRTLLRKIEQRLDEINIKLDALVESRKGDALDKDKNTVSDFFNL
jgi:hypothetical protein